MEAAKKSNSSYEVVVKKVISASKEEVFEAWTNPEIMNKWYVGGKGFAKTSVDLKVGGKYSNEMFIEPGEETCNVPKTQESYLHTGEYLEIKRPDKIVFTWNSPVVSNTIVTVEMKEVTGGTEVTITHRLQTEADCKGHTQGWTYALESLSRAIGN